MAAPLDISLPPSMNLGGGWTIEFAAVDPLTGADVSGVLVSSANIVGSDTASPEATPAEKLEPFMLVAGPDA